MRKQTAILLSILMVSGSFYGCSSMSGFKQLSPKQTETVKTEPAKSKKETRHRKNKNKNTNVTETPGQFKNEQLRLSEQVLSGRWTIHSVEGKSVTGDDDQWPYIEFDVNTNKFYASNGCNILNGQFKIASGQQISMTDIISSRRQCQEGEYQDINRQLPLVHSYSLEEQNNEYYLHLHNDRNITVMTLRKHNMDYLNGPWIVNEINGQKCQNQDVRLVIDIPEGLIHGNTGCNILNGKLYEDPVKTHSIQFHNIVTTRTTSQDISTQATEMALLIALEEVEYAKPGSHGTVKLLDKRNRTVLKLFPLNP